MAMIALLVLSTFVALAVRIYTFESQLPSTGEVDALIVLGAAVHGNAPSPVYEARLQHALHLLQQERVPLVILTGGARDANTATEAAVGARYLEARGIERRRMLLETQSRTTFENLCFAQQLGRARNLRTYALVSDPLHLARAVHLARGLGLTVLPAGTPYSRYVSAAARFQFLLRETYLFTAHAVFPRRKCSSP